MINLLIFLVVVSGVILIARLVRVVELASAIRGVKHEEIQDKDNKMNAGLMIVFMIAFFAFCFWQYFSWRDKMLPESASEHGVDIDLLMDFNMAIIILVFFITHILLFYFAAKYYFRKENKAYYFTHSNKLELLWTSVPAVVLAIIIIYGLATWNKITQPAPPDALTIEIYGKQFDWTARYTGPDGKLGNSNYRLIQGTNELGLDSLDPHSLDDIIIKNEFHIPLGKAVNFIFRSRDVIHSAYFPHFRAQMNVVPGMATNLHFVPSITTAQMRKKTGNPAFDYILLCNKICGAAHWNMQMTIIVDEEDDYKTWLREQQPYFNMAAQIQEKSSETTEIVAAVN